MRKVKDAVDLTTNEKIYFKGHAKATYTSEGKDVESELTELSAEVSKLEEQVPLVFEAIYETTTYEEIVAAYNANKHVIVKYTAELLSLAKVKNDVVEFTALSDNISILVRCFKNGNWVGYTIPLEKTANKVTSLSSASTNTQYPSAKAVYEALQNVGGGDDTSLREDIFGKTTSKEFAINGYHAPTADTLAVNIAQGEVFHFRLETLGAAITKYQFYIKHDGDSSQTSMAYFSADENYSMYAIRPIVEFGITTSSGWVTEKGNVKLTITQGGVTEPYNLMEIGSIAISEEKESVDVLEAIPNLLKFKKIKMLCEFIYAESRTKKGTISLNTENVQMGVVLDNLMQTSTNTHYIIDLNLDKNRIDACVECHSNSFGNLQVADGNQGKNFGKTVLGYPINKFVINLPLLAGDKFTFYGK